VTFAKTTLLTFAALTMVACSGSDASPGTTVAETSPSVTEPAAATTTSTGGSTTTSTTSTGQSTTSTSTSTTIPATPVMPLTGLPITDPALAARPAVVVKVSNDPGARPQSGLEYADIVFEAWGAGPTRFATVFQSQDAPKVGPIRSARTQDVDLVGSFNGAVFACSGGNNGAIAAIRGSDLLVLTESQGPGWYLDKTRKRPHATFNDTASLRSNAAPDRPGPAVQFKYRDAGASATGQASDGFKLHIEGVHAEWHFDAASNKYQRSQEGHPHVMANGDRVAFNNVIVLWIDYGHSTADVRSPDGGTIGSGDAVVFTNGKQIPAHWSRADRLHPVSLTDASGAPILLTQGTTWFELANSGKGTFPGTDELEIL
jgi:Protein of unknown function (DUF3048) N-terminal domain/Protein of unknown function (DUF3048) C-terminal domain